MSTLSAFSKDELQRAKILLATQVASMMGRKLEEADWSSVYCRAKGIPDTRWSNLHIDVNYKGLGLEMKALRIQGLNDKPLKSFCGTTQMHPSATRSIRIDNIDRDPNEVMRDVFTQYAELIRQRTERVREAAPGIAPDMRTGWLIWEDNLTEFLYFEEPMAAPSPDNYFAEWNVTPARGVRKASKSLWIFDNISKQKRYSVTTSAGIKIQPYFDIPYPSDPNLYYFRVQGEPSGADTVLLWVARSTAVALENRLGSLERDVVSAAILDVIEKGVIPALVTNLEDDLAVAVPVTAEAHAQLMASWDAVSDEHRAQLLLKALS